jgi:hypothetical protein
VGVLDVDMVMGLGLAGGQYLVRRVAAEGDAIS